MTACLAAQSWAIVCDGPYKNQRLSLVAAQAAIKAKANLCGSDLSDLDLSGMDLSQINLSGAKLSGVNLSQANLPRADLEKTYFYRADLSYANLEGANLRSASVEYANLKSANLKFARMNAINAKSANFKQADLYHAHLPSAQLNYANFSNADLSDSNLSQADLSYANLSNTSLKGALLVHSDLTGTTIKNANFANANFNDAFFQPVINEKSLPNLVGLSASQQFNHVRLSDTQGIAVLVNLRAAYAALNFRRMERTLTAMVKTKEMQMTWQSGGWSRIEAAASYLLFYLPVEFGASPGRALRLLLYFGLLLSAAYYISCYQKSARIGISWQSRQRLGRQCLSASQPDKIYYQWIKLKPSSGFCNAFNQQWRCIKIALGFSLLSTFSVIWRAFNVDSWVGHVQDRQWRYYSCGWIRIVAGSQALISAYLLVIWALTYFGKPFEW